MQIKLWTHRHSHTHGESVSVCALPFNDDEHILNILRNIWIND